MEYPIFTKRDTLTKTARTFLPTQFNPFECKLGTIVSREWCRFRFDTKYQ